MALNGRDRQGQPLSGAQTGHRPAPRGGFISRGVNAVTGLAAEAIASRKDNKAAPTTYSDELAVPTSHKQSDKYSSQDHLGDSFVADTREGNISDNASELSGLDSDEEELDLDEAAQEIRTGSAEGVRQPPPTGNMLSPAAIKTLASSFVEQFPPPRVPVGTLQLPVILPQRRPGNKRRGFVQAYAPMLEQAGIGDAAFLSFCDYFEQAIKVNTTCPYNFHCCECSGDLTYTGLTLVRHRKSRVQRRGIYPNAYRTDRLDSSLDSRCDGSGNVHSQQVRTCLLPS